MFRCQCSCNALKKKKKSINLNMPYYSKTVSQPNNILLIIQGSIVIIDKKK